MESMDKLVALCKRRGFIFPSSEIYGGLNGCWDYGPLGVELKRNIKETWWRDMVAGHDDLAVCPGAPDSYSMVGLDCSILMNPRVWEASGHVGGFSDPMQTCRQCKKLFRADQVGDMLKESDWVKSLTDAVGLSSGQEQASIQPETLQKWINKHGKKQAAGLALVRNPQATMAWIAERMLQLPNTNLDLVAFLQYVATERFTETGLVTPCPACGGDLTAARSFNLMFKTHVGAMEDSSSIAYLRPETAQGIFVNFKNVCDTSRVKVPFGIAQMGKAFRNEINPRNFTFRSREFEQMEIEFFCEPERSMEWYTYWRDRRFRWYVDLGLKSEKLRLREHQPDELAHYARGCADVEYSFPFGISELEGIANRTDFDLKQHMQFSGKDLMYFDDQASDPDKRRYVPYVIEPSAGADRATLAFLCEAYTEDVVENEPRTVMRFHPRLAPIKAAVLPLVKKDGMPEKAHEIYRALKRRYNVFYDEKGAIGRRYRRQDEAGTPYCITIDGQTLTDGTVTIRDRDTLKQDRIHANEVVDHVSERITK